MTQNAQKLCSLPFPYLKEFCYWCPYKKSRLPAIAPLTQLTSLDLINSNIDAKVAFKIASIFTGLVRLNLSQNKIGPKGAQALTSLSNLKQLNLYGNKIGDSGADKIYSLTQIEEIDLGHNKISPQRIPPKDFAFQQLHKLSFEYNTLHLEGVQSIVNLCKNLRTLNLRLCSIPKEGLELLSTLTKLEDLNVGFNAIDSTGVKIIAPSMKQLTSLDISDNNLETRDAFHLSTTLTNLTYLNLEGNYMICVEGGWALATRLTRLKIMDLSHTIIHPLTQSEIDKYLANGRQILSS